MMLFTREMTVFEDAKMVCTVWGSMLKVMYMGSEFFSGVSAVCPKIVHVNVVVPIMA